MNKRKNDNRNNKRENENGNEITHKNNIEIGSINQIKIKIRNQN